MMRCFEAPKGFPVVYGPSSESASVGLKQWTSSERVAAMFSPAISPVNVAAMSSPVISPMKVAKSYSNEVQNNSNTGCHALGCVDAEISSEKVAADPKSVMRSPKISQRVSSSHNHEASSQQPEVKSAATSAISADPVLNSISKLQGFVKSSLDKECDLSEWWLLDTGASGSIVSSRFVAQHPTLKERALPSPLTFTTASGEKVSIDRETMIAVQLELHCDGRISRRHVLQDA